METVVDIDINCKWGRTYLVQTFDETEAKEKAYKMFKQEFEMLQQDFNIMPDINNIPNTIEEIKNQDDIMIDIGIIGWVDHILI